MALESTTPISTERLSAGAEFNGLRRELRRVGALALTYHFPKTESLGHVLVVPGWSGPRSGPADILVFLADALAEAGWTAVRMDLPGRGDSPGDLRSDGLDEMIAASLSVIDTFPAGPRGIVGLCSGGNVALGTAPLLKDAFVVALSTLPFQPARTQKFENRRRWKNIKQYASKAFSPNTWLRLVRGEVNLDRVKKNVTASEKPAEGERNLKDSARDIERELLGWKGSALLIYGGGDEEAPPARAHFEKLHAAGLGKPSATRFHTVPGANHNYYGRPWRAEAAREMLSFLSQLKKS